MQYDRQDSNLHIYRLHCSNMYVVTMHFTFTVCGYVCDTLYTYAKFILKSIDPYIWYL